MSELKVIAHIYNDYSKKFGIPRQSNIIDIESKIIFEPEYRVKEAFRGIEEFNYLWLIWDFSESHTDFSPTVRPPMLGGNIRMGVFASRSPFRPNSLGLSSVKFKSIEFSEENGPILTVTGADLLNGTPIYDIKPYLKYADAHNDATNGFANSNTEKRLDVEIPNSLLKLIPTSKQEILINILEQDPRPTYKYKANEEYGLSFANFNVKFTVNDSKLKVTKITNIENRIYTTQL